MQSAPAPHIILCHYQAVRLSKPATQFDNFLMGLAIVKVMKFYQAFHHTSQNLSIISSLII